VETRVARISTGGAASVEGLKGPETMLGASPLETATTLTTGRFNDLHLAVEGVDLRSDVEDAGIGLVVASELSCQAPIVRASGQVHGLVIGRRLP
jgi:hypothetical protein